MQGSEGTHGSEERLLLRGAAIVGLAGVALIHVLDLQAKFEEVPYIGWLYVGLVVAALMGGTTQNGRREFLRTSACWARL